MAVKLYAKLIIKGIDKIKNADARKSIKLDINCNSRTDITVTIL